MRDLAHFYVPQHAEHASVMYTRYFGLQEKPFAIAPDPHYLYMSDLHKEALAHLLYGIDSDGCIILLTGDVGTGKTTVCRFLFDQLPKTTDTAIILNPKLTAKELLVTICEELELADSIRGSSTKSYLDAINHHLLDSHSKGRTTALFIDEAQNLSVGVLEQLRLLTNLETDKQKLLKIVLLGQTELRTQLERPEATQINQRVTSRYHLLPLGQEDIYSYIQHRTNIAGGGKTVFFTEKALERIVRLSRGIPRLINVICDRALLGAYSENKHRVTAQILEQAAAEVLGEAGYAKAKKKAFFSFFSPITFLALTLATLFTIGTLFMFFENSVLDAWNSPQAPRAQSHNSSPPHFASSLATTNHTPRKEQKGIFRIQPYTAPSSQNPLLPNPSTMTETPPGTTIKITPVEVQ